MTTKESSGSAIIQTLIKGPTNTLPITHFGPVQYNKGTDTEDQKNEKINHFEAYFKWNLQEIGQNLSLEVLSGIAVLCPGISQSFILMLIGLKNRIF